MIAKKIKREEIEDGDIIYAQLESSNEFVGDDFLLTGTDVIFIIDDASMAYEGVFLVNGGHEICIEDEEDVYKLGHYSELLKSIN